MVKITPDPPHLLPYKNTLRSLPDKLLIVRQSVSAEEALTTACEILDCAAATAYESAEGLDGPRRKLALAAVHLLETAQALVESALARNQPGSARKG